jgi:beta-glucosidase
MKRRNLLISLAMTVAMTATAQQLPYQNAKLSADTRAADLCGRLTLEEKSLIMCDTSPAIPRLGIPQFQWWSEALHGDARNGFATVFPITMGMAASWDDALLYQVFNAVSDEARVKHQIAKKSGNVKRYQGLSFWTPNINIFRDPRWGRGQETYGEDPYLTSRMGLAVVRGLQGPDNAKYRKLLACAKHFAVHSGPEWNRHQFNVEDLPARDLWETYLPAFKALAQEGHVAEVMCAYQRVDGDPCCGNNRLLQQILRDEWHYKGMVVSDCGAISDFWEPGRHGVSPDAKSASAKAVRSGTDVECGSNYHSLPEAVKAGAITEAQIDVSVKRLLKARFELGDLDPDELVPWTKISENVIASKEHRQLALDMARESMTLLQNRNNILPLAKSGLKIAVMGPNANDSIMQWGNYNGYPLGTVTILKGIRTKAKDVKYISGCGLTRNEIMDSRYGEITTEAGNSGMNAKYWNNETMNGTPVATADLREPINQSNGGATVFAPGVELEHFSACYEGTFRPIRSESLLLNVAADDKVRVIVNSDTLINNWKGRERIQEVAKPLDVKAGETYHIKIDYVQATALATIKFDIIHKQTANTADIVNKVGDADVVIFVGGISPRLEGEEMKVSEPGFKGGDRTDIELPQAQRDVIAALHQAGKRVVYVNCSGGAVGLVPESNNAEAILQAWYPGEQGGTAVADVLFGDYNPSGKLPVTFYKNVNQLPDFMDYRMAGRTYRYFKGAPLFPFGYGLSYTTFAFGKPSYKNGKVTVNVKNTGKRAGTETVQLYIKNVADANGPIKSLRSFKRIQLNAGETKSVEIDCPRTSFEGWDVKSNTIRVVPGNYEIMVGSSSVDKDLQKTIVKINK